MARFVEPSPSVRLMVFRQPIHTSDDSLATSCSVVVFANSHSGHGMLIVDLRISISGNYTLFTEMHKMLGIEYTNCRVFTHFTT